MTKNVIAGVLSATTFLALACLCCPVTLIGFFRTPTPIPPTATPTSTPTPTPEPTATSEYVPVCAQDLAQILRESGSYYPSGLQLDSEVTLVTYTVSGDIISDPVYAAPVPYDLKTDQKDTAAQYKIWNFVTAILPADQRTSIHQFGLFTDGVNGSLGSVVQTDNPHEWKLEMDIEDARHFPDLATTLIHEFGHLLTLNDSQVPTDWQVFNHPDDQRIYDQEAAACTTYFLFEGCSKPDSYINTFFNQFWPDIYTEWQSIDAEADPDVQEQKLDSFYQEYADQFVSSYAVTSPEEDLAESFTYFIFKPKPAGTSIADRKVLFFYGYPELTSLRSRLLGNLCAHLEKP